MRSCLSLPVFILITACLSTSAIIFSFFTSSAKVSGFHIKLWGISTCFLFGVKLFVHGRQHWRQGSGGVVLFNHTSFFDIFAMIAALPDIRFGAKIELFKIPVFGSAMRRVGILPIDRERREKVFAIFQKAVDRLKSGEKIALAPEGTRNPNPSQLANFKSGPFIFALQSRVDLIPVVIKGAYEVLPKGQVLPNSSACSRTIHLHILEPISTNTEIQERKVELQQNIKLRMQSVLDQKENQRENN